MTDEAKGLTAEDARIIAAAANARKISPDYIDVWCNAMRADAEGTRKALASLPEGWTGPADERHAEKGVAASLAKQGFGGLRSVAAADLGSHALRVINPPSALELGRRYAFGSTVPNAPAPVKIADGVDPRDYTPEQQYQAFAHKLGGRFTDGVPRPPAGDQYFVPSPNDPYQFNSETGQFEAKPDNRAMPI